MFDFTRGFCPSGLTSGSLSLSITTSEVSNDITDFPTLTPLLPGLTMGSTSTLCLVRDFPLAASLALMFDLTLGALPSGRTDGVASS